jgi:hypothetical protein
VASVGRKAGGKAAGPSVIVTTDTMKEKALNAALAALNATDWVRAPATRIRIKT